MLFMPYFSSSLSGSPHLRGGNIVAHLVFGVVMGLYAKFLSARSLQNVR